MPIQLSTGAHLLLWVFPLALTLFVIARAIIESKSGEGHQ